MGALLGTELAALLARTDVAQAALARLNGHPTHQVNNWCRSRAAMPPWTAVLAMLTHAGRLPRAIQILLGEVQFSWHETLGVPPKADVGTVRRTIARLTHQYHPDMGDSQEQLTRVNAAYDRARSDPTGPGRTGCVAHPPSPRQSRPSLN